MISDHVKGLDLKQYEGYSTFIYPTKDTLVGNLKYLFDLLIEDYHIWKSCNETRGQEKKGQ